MMVASSLLVVLLVLGVASAAFNPASYTNSTQLDPAYKVFWKVDQAGKRMHLALQVATDGWFGFGLGEQTSGSMPGADVVVLSFATSAGEIGDYFTTGFVTPSKDSCQDWSLDSSQFLNGVRTVEISRALNTGDTQDRPFVPGLNRVIFAFGANGMGVNTLQYHGSNRRMATIEFWPSPADAGLVAGDQGVKTATFQLGNFTVPSTKTTYACAAFPIPLSPGSADHHVIQVDAKVTSLFAHHLLVHICDNTTGGYVEKYSSKPGVCYSPVGNPSSGCRGLLYAWALGIDSLIVPKEAGYRMGFNNPAFTFIVIEVHLNNPSSISGGVDNSGVVLHFTPNLRQYDAATITLGDPFVRLSPIPAGFKQVFYETSCSSACTAKFPHTINVFASFLHMHSIGKQMWTTQFRNGALLRTTNRVDFYDYGAQQQTRLNLTIAPGDHLNTHCTFDSTGRTGSTMFGVESTDEMCMDFISYYPRMEFQNSDFSYCGFVGYPQGNATLCGSADGLSTGASLIYETNPSNSDLAATRGKIFGTPGSVCTAPNPTAPTPTDNPSAAYSIVPLFLLSVLLPFLLLLSVI